jgi:voltage-gated potassium channel
MLFSKPTVRKIFDDPKANYFSLVNDVLSFATIVSILVIVLETVPSLSVYNGLFILVEWIAVTLFTLEYVGRLWSAKKPSTYAFSFFGVIDLVAILPSFLGLGNLSFLKSARIVRIIRFLRLARLSKLSRVDMKDAEETMGIFGFNIALYIVTLVLVMLILGVALHIISDNASIYSSIPSGMFWAFSVFLGGLPAPIPEGTAGLWLFVIAKFCGLALFGLLVGVVGKLFNQWILGKKE